MNGKPFTRAAARWLAPTAALGLLTAAGAVRAQEPVDLHAELAAATATEPDGPAFQPSTPAQFEAAFAAFAEPAQPALPDHAVDITAIEPAEPSATPIGPGVASYYGRRFHGRRTANGERFDMNALTAAHKTLPFGSLVRVTNARNGRSVVVRINDRGPFIAGRHIDLSRAAAQEIGIIRSGHGPVELELLNE